MPYFHNVTQSLQRVSLKGAKVLHLNWGHLSKDTHVRKLVSFYNCFQILYLLFLIKRWVRAWRFWQFEAGVAGKKNDYGGWKNYLTRPIVIFVVLGDSAECRLLLPFIEINLEVPYCSTVEWSLLDLGGHYSVSHTQIDLSLRLNLHFPTGIPIG